MCSANVYPEAVAHVFERAPEHDVLTVLSVRKESHVPDYPPAVRDKRRVHRRWLDAELTRSCQGFYLYLLKLFPQPLKLGGGLCQGNPHPLFVMGFWRRIYAA